MHIHFPTRKSYYIVFLCLLFALNPKALQAMKSSIKRVPTYKIEKTQLKWKSTRNSGVNNYVIGSFTDVSLLFLHIAYDICVFKGMLGDQQYLLFIHQNWKKLPIELNNSTVKVSQVLIGNIDINNLKCIYLLAFHKSWFWGPAFVFLEKKNKDKPHHLYSFYYRKNRFGGEEFFPVKADNIASFYCTKFIKNSPYMLLLELDQKIKIENLGSTTQKPSNIVAIWQIKQEYLSRLESNKSQNWGLFRILSIQKNPQRSFWHNMPYIKFYKGRLSLLLLIIACFFCRKDINRFFSWLFDNRRKAMTNALFN